MLSISHAMKGAAAAVDYYADPRKEDYYLHGLDKQGRWFGGAAQPLGLSGQAVTREAFRHLLNGFSPDGREALVQNAGRENRDCCWDMTFNAPKSVSVLWALSPPDLRRQIEAELQTAVQAALARAEAVAGITRSGPGGKVKEPAQLLWALFPEGTSRAQDPHLHTHAVLLNLGHRHNGTFGSIYTLNLFRWKMALGAVFQAELASRLQQRFGLHIEPDRSSFRLPDVPRDLCRQFSKRRQTIERTMAERGVSGAVAAKTAAKDTRPAKEEVPPDRLFAHWHQVRERVGWRPELALHPERTGKDQALTMDPLEPWVRQAVQALPAKDQTRSRLIRAAARVALENGADGQALFQALRQLRTTDGRRVLWERPQGVEPQREHASRQTHAPSQDQSAERIRRDQPVAARTQSLTSAHPPMTEHRDPAPRNAIRDDPGRIVDAERPSAPPQEAVERATNETTVPAGTRAERQSPRSELPGDAAGSQKEEPDSRKAKGNVRSRSTRSGPAKQHAPEHIRGKARQQSSPQSAPFQREAPGHESERDRPQSRTGSAGREREESRRTRNGPKRKAEPKRKAQGQVKTRRRERMPRRPAFIRIEWQRVFPKAPAWSPASKVRAPVIVVGHRDPRWWSIRWKQRFQFFEVRVQDRILFRNVPKWNPLHGLTAPALRFTTKASTWEPMKPKRSPDRKTRRSSPSKDHGQSH